jgi:hypothetical protein
MASMTESRQPTLRIADTLTFLLGVWDVDRSIDDRRSGTQGTFSGKASLAETGAGNGAAVPERAHYEETGDLLFGSYRGPARRTLEYVRLDGGAALLCFADGRPFIDLDLCDGACDRTHDCGPDLYEIGTVVISDDVVEQHWRVRGPSKDYTAVTTLTRDPAWFRQQRKADPGIGPRA